MRLADLPALWRAVRLVQDKRRWRCPDDSCSMGDPPGGPGPRDQRGRSQAGCRPIDDAPQRRKNRCLTFLRNFRQIPLSEF
ncbi:hypothetical protein [Candidatus Poriferisodalis sp.]|uniref:hypothetical protein n=1 Tax=Candidatus Poriferisodalis sp. TaxID=3101277 RepID=UPI003C6F63E7